MLNLSGKNERMIIKKLVSDSILANTMDVTSDIAFSIMELYCLGNMQ
jgi:hypothetical protein